MVLSLMVERLQFERRKRERDTIGQLTCKWTRAVDVRRSLPLAGKAKFGSSENSERERGKRKETDGRLVDVSVVAKGKKGGTGNSARS